MWIYFPSVLPWVIMKAELLTARAQMSCLFFWSQHQWSVWHLRPWRLLGSPFARQWSTVKGDPHFMVQGCCFVGREVQLGHSPPLPSSPSLMESQIPTSQSGHNVLCRTYLKLLILLFPSSMCLDCRYAPTRVFVVLETELRVPCKLRKHSTN